MPTIQDEEESLCLLASDLQDNSKDRKEMSDPNWPKNGSDLEWDEEKPSLLSQGNAEKAFFNVCKTNEEEEDDEDDDIEEDEDCVEVMNDIIGTLEADHVGLNNGSSQADNEMETASRNSRSLVVDIHLPPSMASEDKSSLQNQTNTSTPRPCKHEVNRFQRCYSDGSQASPKKKAKVRLQLLNF